MGIDISLDGAEVTVIKALGFSGGETDGLSLLEKASGLEVAEVIDTLQGLIAQGYVETDARAIRTKEDLEKAHFNVNSGYSKHLKEAMDPNKDKKSKRIRRE